MKIEWNKWVNNLLPPLVRRTLMQEYASFFVLPVKSLYESFSNWKEKAKVKAAGTPQVCMLEKIVKDSISVDIVILEGDGRPADFVIQTNLLDVDKERQLFALIDQYKLAGKRYAYQNTALFINSYWSEYVCEQQTAFITWKEYLCEHKYRPERYVFTHFDGQYVTIEVKEPFASDMRVDIYRHELINNGEALVPGNIYETYFSFPKGFTGILKKTFPYGYEYVMTRISLSPDEDEEYKYKYEIV